MKDDNPVMERMYLKYSYLLIFMSFFFTLKGQESTFFNKAIDAGGVDLCSKILHYNDTLYLLSVTSVDLNNFNQEEISIYKVNSEGFSTKLITFSDSLCNYIGGMGEVDENGDVVLCFTKWVRANGRNDGDCYLVKISSLGDTLWTRTYTDTNFNFMGVDLANTKDGGYLAFGWQYPVGGVASDLVIKKVDSMGNELWSQTYGYSFRNEIGYHIESTKKGYYLLSGKSQSASGNISGYLVKIDSMGMSLWNKMYSYSSLGNVIGQTIESLDGGYVAFGTTRIDENLNRGWLLKMDTNGVYQWDSIYGVENTFGMDLSDNFWGGLQLEDSSYVVFGTTKNKDLIVDGFLGEPDGWVLKVDMNGNELWSRVYTNSYGAAFFKDDYLYDLVQTSDGGFLAAGSCFNANQDAWVIKLDSCGCDSVSCWYDSLSNCGIQITTDTIIDTTGTNDTIGNNDSTITTDSIDNILDFNQDANFHLSPNPVDDVLRIVYSKRLSVADIKIVNSAGVVLSSHYVYGDKIDLLIDVSGLPSGIYTVHLISPDGQFIKKVLIK